MAVESRLMEASTPTQMERFQSLTTCPSRGSTHLSQAVMSTKLDSLVTNRHSIILKYCGGGGISVDEGGDDQARVDDQRGETSLRNANGGERPLGIPTIRDRVIQTAAKIVIEPIFEADFEDNAYGYRPARGAVDAVKEVHRHLCALGIITRRTGSGRFMVGGLARGTGLEDTNE